MSFRAKPVAIALVAVIVVIPVAALASCSQSMPAMTGSSDPDMMGMFMPPAAPTVIGLHNESCCVVAPAQLLPKNESLMVWAAAGPILPQSLRSKRPEIFGSAVLASTPPAQAFLCVFLI